MAHRFCATAGRAVAASGAGAVYRLIAFTLIHSLAPVVSRLAQGVRGRLLVAILLVAVVVGLFVALGIATAAFVRSEAGLSALFARMALIIEDASQTLPPWLADNLPIAATKSAA